MNPAFIALALQAAMIIGAILWKIIKGSAEIGTTTAQLESAKRELIKDINNMREDVDELRRGVVVNNDLQNERSQQFFCDLTELRLKIASYTGDWNGGRHRKSN